jgi:hypothetical protein
MARKVVKPSKGRGRGRGIGHGAWGMGQGKTCLPRVRCEAAEDITFGVFDD